MSPGSGVIITSVVIICKHAACNKYYIACIYLYIVRFKYIDVFCSKVKTNKNIILCYIGWIDKCYLLKS